MVKEYRFVLVEDGIDFLVDDCHEDICGQLLFEANERRLGEIHEKADYQVKEDRILMIGFDQGNQTLPHDVKFPEFDSYFALVTFFAKMAQDIAKTH